MLAPQDISIFLNNALKPAHYQAELDADTPLPESIRDMPDQVSGHLVGLDAPTVHDIAAAWKRVMIMIAWPARRRLDGSSRGPDSGPRASGRRCSCDSNC